MFSHCTVHIPFCWKITRDTGSLSTWTSLVSVFTPAKTAKYLFTRVCLINEKQMGGSCLHVPANCCSCSFPSFFPAALPIPDAVFLLSSVSSIPVRTSLTSHVSASLPLVSSPPALPCSLFFLLLFLLFRLFLLLLPQLLCSWSSSYFVCAFCSLLSLFSSCSSLLSFFLPPPSFYFICSCSSSLFSLLPLLLLPQLLVPPASPIPAAPSLVSPPDLLCSISFLPPLPFIVLFLLLLPLLSFASAPPSSASCSSCFTYSCCSQLSFSSSSSLLNFFSSSSSFYRFVPAPPPSSHFCPCSSFLNFFAPDLPPTSPIPAARPAPSFSSSSSLLYYFSSSSSFSFVCSCSSSLISLLPPAPPSSASCSYCFTYSCCSQLSLFSSCSSLLTSFPPPLPFIAFVFAPPPISFCPCFAFLSFFCSWSFLAHNFSSSSSFYFVCSCSSSHILMLLLLLLQLLLLVLFPFRIRIHWFRNRIKNCNLLIPKAFSLKEHPALQKMKFLNFFIFLLSWIRIHWPNWILILSGSSPKPYFICSSPLCSCFTSSFPSRTGMYSSCSCFSAPPDSFSSAKFPLSVVLPFLFFSSVLPLYTFFFPCLISALIPSTFVLYFPFYLLPSVAIQLLHSRRTIGFHSFSLVFSFLTTALPLMAGNSC